MITLENYYDPKSRYLTRSKMMTYQQSPLLFLQYWILGEKPEKAKSAAFKVGGAVDNCLAQVANTDNYAVLEIPEGEKDTYYMTKAGKEYKQSLIDAGKEVLTRSQYDEIIELASAVERTSAYQIIKNWTKQKVLCFEQKIGEFFDGLAGLPDFIHYDQDTKIVDIVDLKTSRTLNLKAYFFHCLEYGYFMQAALYVKLARKEYPDAVKVRFWHLVVEKSDAYNVELFQFDPELVEDEIVKLDMLIDTIANDKEFKKHDASFETPSLISKQYVQ